jgi:hypothetical protein
VLELIVRHRPDAAHQTTQGVGSLPLHLVGSKTPVDRVRRHPHRQATPTPFGSKRTLCGGCLPPHAALDNNRATGTLEVVERLVEPCPESLAVSNERGMLPVHVHRYLALQHSPRPYFLSRRPPGSSRSIHHALEFGSAGGDLVPLRADRLPLGSVPDRTQYRMFGLLHCVGSAAAQFFRRTRIATANSRASRPLARDSKGRAPLNAAIDKRSLDRVPVLASLRPEPL